MELISREDAWVKGETRYFTGKPCKRGHVAQRSVTSHNCVECRRTYANIWQRAWYKNNLEEARARGRKQAAKRQANGYKPPARNPEVKKAWKTRNKEDLNAKRRANRAARPGYWIPEIAKLRSTVEGTLKYLCRKPNRKHLKDALVDKFCWQRGRCAISGVEMTWGGAGKGRIGTNISIDRIDSTKGYTADNVQLVCCTVNRMKSDMTQSELLDWCKNITDTETARNDTDSFKGD